MLVFPENTEAVPALSKVPVLHREKELKRDSFLIIL